MFRKFFYKIKNKSKKTSDFYPESGFIIKINLYFTKEKKPYYLCITLVNNQERRIYFWINRVSAEKWKLISKLKKDDAINFKGEWNNNFFSVLDFEIIKTNKISSSESWPKIVKRMDDLKKIAFVDIETTDHYVENNIIEIGYIVCLDSEILTKKNYLVLPNKLNKYRKNLNKHNNISIEELKKESNKWEDLLPIIQEDLQDCLIISHNLKSFDYHKLKKGNFFKEKSTYYFFDTLKPSKDMIKEKGLDSKSDLQTLIRMIRKDENFIEDHRALSDAFLHMELFNYLNKSKKEIELLYKIH
ncbi:MAG: Anaerobic glycerol-3-phosphate dehydrogenase subunit B [Mycoplasmataceae bacterium]|nr:MAG: Anaerobic glycerol-3-phosphate dehydrogenase subunit B [Mycoplasmataceae bacterium]